MSRSAATAGAQAASPHAHDTGLLVLRLALGLTMAAHGAQKLFGWFGGGGLHGTGQFFAASGYPSPHAFAAVAGLTETLGGLGMALGLLTPLAGAGLLGTLVNAIAVKWGGGFFAPAGVEYELFLALAALAVTLTGPGAFAADRLLPGLRAHRFSYGIAAAVLGLVVAGVTLMLRD
ncbi:DoxX family protein [Streptomyces sp. NPDC051320]|uniref:DoxX family protein n=1 Tax=Streptomyces sp. NPDC051320 TaxID=3154644 RepID=UPI00342EF0C4